MKANSARMTSRLIGKAQAALTTSNLLDACASVDPSSLKLKSILVPIDFSKASVSALKYAVPLAERFGATICLVHVVEKASFINDLDNVALPLADEKLARIAGEDLISLSKKEIKQLIPVFPHTRIGKPFVEIVTLAKTQNIDLIVIATHGHTGLKHVLMGSTAEKVVRHAPCPVLVVREREPQFIKSKTQPERSRYENQTNIETW